MRKFFVFKQSRIRRRHVLLLAMLTTLALASTFIARPALQRRMTLHSETPDYASLEQRRKAAGSDPASEVQTLWDTGHMPQRLFAITMANEACKKDRSRVAALRPLLLQALNDADSDIRHLAGHTLMLSTATKDVEQLIPLLSDADPYVRANAIELLRLSGNTTFTRAMVPLLGDSDPSVMLAAAGWLSKHHDVDFGIRANVSAAENRAAFEECRLWVKARESGFPPAPTTPVSERPTPVRAPTAAMRTLDGQPLAPATLQGKTVILHFWHTRLRKSQSQLADLAELAARYPGQITVLNVPVDAVPVEHEYKHEHRHAAPGKKDLHHDHADGEHCETEVDDEELLEPHSPAVARLDIETFCRERGVTGTVLLDTGELSAAYIANDLPTTVMVDPEGVVRRRFTGPRPQAALEAMLKEVMTAGPRLK